MIFSQTSKLIASFVLMLVVSLSSPLYVYAQFDLGFEEAETIAETTGLSNQAPSEFIKKGINTVLSVISLVALAVLVYGGVLFITSIGNEDRAAKAKRLLLYAIVGLLLIGLSALIVNIVIDIFQGAPGA